MHVSSILDYDLGVLGPYEKADWSALSVRRMLFHFMRFQLGLATSRSSHARLDPGGNLISRGNKDGIENMRVAAGDGAQRVPEQRRDRWLRIPKVAAMLAKLWRSVCGVTP
jgi:hypothetical protein